MITKIKQTSLSVLVGLFAIFAVVPLPVQAATSCEEGNSAACLESTKSTSSVMNVIVIGINFLAGAVGLVAVIMLIVAGIQYTASAGNPQAVQAAKTKITNVLIGLLCFFLLYSFMQWLIPGGFL